MALSAETLSDNVVTIDHLNDVEACERADCQIVIVVDHLNAPDSTDFAEPMLLDDLNVPKLAVQNYDVAFRKTDSYQ